MGSEVNRQVFLGPVVMKLPLIAIEHGDVSVFSTETDAARYLEVTDIRNGEYDFFDADGYVVQAVVDSKGNISFALHSPPVLSAETLKPKLVGFLNAVGCAPSEGAELPVLIEAVARIASTR